MMVESVPPLQALAYGFRDPQVGVMNWACRQWAWIAPRSSPVSLEYLPAAQIDPSF
jgi:hypothetical protein